MIRFSIKSLLVVVLASQSIFFFSQNFLPPLRIPLSLSANFGDLRNNHFHSGLDYRTQQAVNKPVYSIDDGYVSRISVSPSGYGLAVYIAHPCGYTSVYGHLNSYSAKIADYIKRKQYEAESYKLDVSLQPDEITVKKGEQIALSGNTGGSGGPHLHFEIRDAKTEETIDAQDFLGKTVTDTQKPDIRLIAFYPVDGKGVVNGTKNPFRAPIGKNGTGTINAWGKIGIGVKAFDKMDGTSSAYVVKSVKLFMDGKQIFSSFIDRFSFDKTRMINTFIDFEEYRNAKSFIMKSFVEPGNSLPFFQAVNNGYVDINEEKVYKFRYELTDAHENKTVYHFSVNGKKQPVPETAKCTGLMSWNMPGFYIEPDFSLSIPTGNLYDNFCYVHNKIVSTKYYSNIQVVNNKPVPLHKNATIWIKIKSAQLNADSASKFGIIAITKTGKEEWIGGTLKNGGVETTISELGGKYAVARDVLNPTIIPFDTANWIPAQRIKLILKDDKSGIVYARGEIDGKFALFANDMKSDVYTYIFDNRLEKGKNHRLVFEVADRAGNKAEYKTEFFY